MHLFKSKIHLFLTFNQQYFHMKSINILLGIIAVLIVMIQIFSFTCKEEKLTNYLIKHNYLDSLHIVPNYVLKYSDWDLLKEENLVNQLESINEHYINARNSITKRNEFYLKVVRVSALSTNFLYVLGVFLVILKGIIIVKKYKHKVAQEQIINIDNLIIILLRIFQIDSESRVTLFVKDEENENMIRIFHRRHIQRENPDINWKLRFSDNEGLPGKAKANPFIVGQELTNEDLWKKTFINNIPGYIFEEENYKELIKNYYRDNFNISDHKFNELSDMKYEIKSYFSAGIMCEELKKVLVLSIDSKKENAFIDFEMFNMLISRSDITQYIYERKDISLSKVLNELLPKINDEDDSREEVEAFNVTHQMTSFKVDPLLVYGMLKYIMDLMHRSVFKNDNNDSD